MAWINVDVDINEFSDNELIEETKRRGYRVVEDDIISAYEVESLHGQLYEALKLGKTELALELARQIACEHTGRIL